ncbi:hypothetical protein BGZ60DRAFT_259272 [Tricladium varicosporioides]|nr:hypothetical protein BGZ60DRAFT_259272 [Hymenoscyphus varicosporioides]
MVGYHLRTWQCYKNRSKGVNRARRHNAQVPRGHAEAPSTVDRYIQPPDIYYQEGAMLNSVSVYVSGAFDSEIWNVQTAPGEIIREYLNWACGSTPSSFRLLMSLTLARMCHNLGRECWAGVLLRVGFNELNICLRDQPYQALPIILILLNLLRDRPPHARKQLLEQCLALAGIYAKAHPIKRILDQVSDMEQRQYDSEFWNSMYAQATSCFVDKLRDQLRDNGDFVCTILRHSNQILLQPEKNRYVQSWVDPVLRHTQDPEYFNSGQNIEQCIVQAVELHGYPELLQVKAALEQQRSATLSDQVSQMLTRHLQALEVPINRIGYRDFMKADDKNGFVKHWRRLTETQDSPQDAWSPEYLLDMLIGWKQFTRWQMKEEVQGVERRLEEVFVILHTQLM